MKLVLFIIACILAAAFAAPLTTSQTEHLFIKFVEQYNKKYEVREFFQKFETFKSNLDLILAHNSQQSSFKMAVNKFTDLSAAEFGQLMGLRTRPELKSVSGAAVAASISETAATPIDWRTKNAVAPVKDQGQCGSCWAFSTVASLEGANAIATGKLVQFSEQQLVDCSASTGNAGCNGGLMTSAFDWIKKNGLCPETAYPYTGYDGSCQKCTAAVHISDYTMVPPTDAGHAQALQTGPLSVAVAASSATFQFYSSGVVSDCSDTELDHGVALVGFYVGQAQGKNVYYLRNSWSSSWGMDGYMSITWGSCALGTTEVDCYPTIAA